MSPRLEFHPGEMRDAARRFENAAAANHTILGDLRGAPLVGVPAPELAHHITPRLTQVRRNAADRRRALREMADFIRSRALLAEIADGTKDAAGRVTDGKAHGLLPGSATKAVSGVKLGIDALARQMEREFLRGGWIDRDGHLHGRARKPNGVRPPHSWARLAKIAKRLPLIGKLDSAAKMVDALFGKGPKGHRIEEAGGILGGLGGSAVLATAASVALMGGPPGAVAVAVLGAAIVGSQLGSSAGRFLGKDVVVPLWNGAKTVAAALADLGKKGLSLAKKGLAILGIHL